MAPKNRPALVSLDALSRSARHLRAESSDEFSAVESSTASSAVSPNPTRSPPRRIPARCRTFDAGTDSPEGAKRGGRRLPQRSVSQKFDRRAILKKELEENLADKEDDSEQS